MAEPENYPRREACDAQADKENTPASRVPGGTWLLESCPGSQDVSNKGIKVEKKLDEPIVTDITPGQKKGT
ncbi:hypothetical protein NDU88_001567 [Pleurodeles waltl]|uniref:Uncharacterized protein n=1 Tax=Pleurodeles waltl TaxID=8319 RepID=A0AAV7S9A8_PLEWA|nr:hypothetical protein NDU88_001567 [Pleurodeles waltl]